MKEPPRAYFVYVIESQDSSGRKVFYVGQTQHTPEKRLAQHQKGKKYCSPCKSRHYVPRAAGAGPSSMKLRYELFSRYNPLWSREEAERIESWLAARLRRQGHRVLGGH
jgi:hypothetical protein